MGKKKEDVVAEDINVVDETVAVEAAAPEAAPAIRVLARYRVEKKDGDAFVYERIRLPETYAGKPGVKEFTAPNGQVTYYVEKLVKKYSDNVVTE